MPHEVATALAPVVAPIAAALVILWLALLALLWRSAAGVPDRRLLRDGLRLVPDVVRLLRRLVVDRTLPRRVRWVVVALLLYLLSPIDLVPDVVPVLGWADDVLVVLVAVRYVVRRAGADAVARHWPGTGPGLALMLGLARADTASRWWRGGRRP